jgi:formylglycine-generating enzyme required for sulfatase activity
MDARVDVYGLGATLYEMLTGRPPFQATSIATVMKLVMTREPTPLRRLKPDVPAELEAIVHRCLQKERARRYPSAKDLADDLDRLIRGEAVRALPATVTYRFRKGVRRHRRGLLLAGSGLLLAAVAATWLVTRGSETSERLARAQERTAAGDYEAAAREYKAVLAKDPGNSEARGGLELLRRRRLDALVEQVQSFVKAGKKDQARATLAKAERLNAPAAQMDALRRLIQSTRTIGIPAAPAWPLVALGADQKEAARLEAPGSINLSPGTYTLRCGELDIPLRVDPDKMQDTTLRLPSKIRPGMAFVPTTDSPAIGFWIDRHEATNRGYLEFIDAVFGDEPLRYVYYPGSWEAVAKPFGDAHADKPVYGLDDVQAFRYLSWRGLRLPSRDEWRQAGRGVDTREFPWGDDASRIEGSDDWNFVLKADVSPYGVVGLVSGPVEPVWTGGASLDSGQLLFDGIGWLGGTSIKYQDAFRLNVSFMKVGDGGGVRGVWSELPEEIRRDPETLRVLARHADAAIRAAAVAALVALAPADLESDLMNAYADPAPAVAGPAIEGLRKAGKDLRALFANSALPIWKLFLAEQTDEIARRYQAVRTGERHPEQKEVPAALAYLGVEQWGDGASLTLTLAEVRWYSVSMTAMSKLYVRAINRPGLDLPAEIGRWLDSPHAHHRAGGMELLVEVLALEKDEAGRRAFAERYRIAERRAGFEERLTDKTEYVREAAQKLLEALEKAGLQAPK